MMSRAQSEILAAAIRVMSEDPGASMQQVAQATGVGRATLYRHYSSREDLIRAIRLHALGEYREALVGVELEAMPAGQAIRRALEVLLPVVDRYRVLMNAPPPDPADPDQRRLVEEIEGPILQVILRGQRAGELRSDLPARFVLRMFTGLLSTGRRAIAEGVVEQERAAELAAAALLTGIAVPGSSR